MSWLRVRAVARRHAYVLQRAPQRWFDILVWPVVDAVLFGSLGVYFARQGGAGDQGLALMLTGIVLFHVIFQSQVAVAAGFLEETWSRNLVNLMVTPLREVEYVAGILLFGLAKMVVAVGLVAVLAAGAYGFGITAVGFGLVVIVPVLFVVGVATGLVVIGLVLRVGQGAEILTWGFIALWLPLTGAFYPVEALPVVLEPVALALPPTHAFAAARAAVVGDPLPWGEVGVAAAGSVVLLALAAWFVTVMLATFRRRGYISRHT